MQAGERGMSAPRSPETSGHFLVFLLLRVVIDPLRFLPVEIAADAKLDGSAFEGIGECRLAAVALVGLFAGSADIHLGDPFPVDLQPQPADDGTVRQALVLVLPARD